MSYTLSNGYTMESTFLSDFNIANAFGTAAIRDTYKRSLTSWKNNYKMLAELEIALNLMCWDCYEKGNMEYSSLYSDLYYECQDVFYDTYGNNEEIMHWHFEITD